MKLKSLTCLGPPSFAGVITERWLPSILVFSISAGSSNSRSNLKIVLILKWLDICDQQLLLMRTAFSWPKLVKATIAWKTLPNVLPKEKKSFSKTNMPFKTSEKHFKKNFTFSIRCKDENYSTQILRETFLFVRKMPQVSSGCTSPPPQKKTMCDVRKS